MPIVARDVAKDSFSKSMKYKGIKNNVPFNNFFWHTINFRYINQLYLKI